MTKPDILIAEDDAVLRNLYIKKFALSGYDIRTAEDGEATWTAIEQKKPDVLILDIHMPKMTGFQVLEKLQQAGREFPVIMLSNFADEMSQLRAKELGADDYFVKKDMTIKSLLEMVDRLLKAWKSVHPENEA
jgi:DNA-binding response OmpR family regulator